MLSRTPWARAAALVAALAFVLAAVPSEPAFAQQGQGQARAGEDGNSGAGGTSGSMSSGNSGRDNKGNGGNASAGTAGDTGSTENTGSTEAPLPENAELLDALGVLDDVTVYGLDVLTGLDIPIELLPPPTEEPVSTGPTDINTGGQGASGETATISTEPGTGSAPAGGSISSASEDGIGASNSGERNRDRPSDNADGGTETTSTGG